MGNRPGAEHRADRALERAVRSVEIARLRQLLDPRPHRHGAQDAHLVIGQRELGRPALRGEPRERLGDREPHRQQILLDVVDAVAEALPILGRTRRDRDLVPALGDDRQGVSRGPDAVRLRVVVERERARIADLQRVPEEPAGGRRGRPVHRIDRVVAPVEVALHPLLGIRRQRPRGERRRRQLAHHVERAVRHPDRLRELPQQVDEIGKGRDFEKLVGDRLRNRVAEHLELVEVERVEQAIDVRREVVSAEPRQAVDGLVERGFHPADHLHKSSLHTGTGRHRTTFSPRWLRET